MKTYMCVGSNLWASGKICSHSLHSCGEWGMFIGRRCRSWSGAPGRPCWDSLKPEAGGVPHACFWWSNSSEPDSKLRSQSSQRYWRSSVRIEGTLEFGVNESVNVFVGKLTVYVWSHGLVWNVLSLHEQKEFLTRLNLTNHTVKDLKQNTKENIDIRTKL